MRRGVMVLAVVANRAPADGAALESLSASGAGDVDSSLPAWPATEELAVGGDESRPETLFGNVADLAVDEAGRIHVLDQYAREVRIFGPDGVFLGTLGGPGEGPGELSRFAASLVLRGDTLLVGDWARRGVHFYRALERVVTEEGRWSGRDLLLRVGGAWDRPDTLFAFTYEETDLGGPGEVLAAILVNSPMWTPLEGGGFAWTTLAATRLRIHGPHGGLERIVAHDAWRRRAPTAGERTAMRELLGDKMVMMGGERAALEQVQVVQPEALPAVTSLAAGSDGRLWVQRMGDAADAHPMALNTPDPPVGWGGGTRDVLDREGRYLATVHLPDRFRLMRIVGDAVYGVRRDQMGAETVVRIRVGEPPGE